MSYNGYANYATWNVELWIDNEYGLYQAKRELLNRRKRPVTSETVRLFVCNNMNGTTPDLTEMKRNREPHGRIHYSELAAHWEDERIEMQTESVA